MKLKPYPKYKDSGIEWLGEIPEGWETKRLKWIARLEYGSSLSQEKREEGSVPVYGSNGIVGEHSRGITGKPVIIVGRKGSYGMISYSEVSCFPIDTTYYIDPYLTEKNIRWLYYLLNSLGLDQITFDTGVPGLSREFAYSKVVPLPPTNEQNKIANYLDQKTSKIDELIKKNESLIELLKEKRKAIISQAVTKGLNPNAKMKDSGVEWLGKIPEEWKVKKIKWLTRTIRTGVTPPIKNEEYYDNGTIPWYAPGDFTDNLILKKPSKYISALAIRKKAGRLFPKLSVLLVGIGATTGKVGLILEDASSNQQINAIIFEEKIDPYYCVYFLKSLEHVIYYLAPFSTLPIMDQRRTGDLLMPVPLIDEQNLIVKFLNKKTTKIDKIIKKIQSQIEKLKEYRQTLISNVVTGKIKVED